MLVECVGDADEAGDGEEEVPQLVPVGSGSIAGEDDFGLADELVQERQQLFGRLAIRPGGAVAIRLAQTREGEQVGVDPVQRAGEGRVLLAHRPPEAQDLSLVELGRIHPPRSVHEVVCFVYEEGVIA